MIAACTGGPPEKTSLDSLSSPAKFLDQGVSAYNENDYQKAIRNFEKALLQYRSIDNQPGIANSCLNLAKTWMAINNNRIAAKYLSKADSVINQARLVQLNDYLHVLNSSLAIKNTDYTQALEDLKPALQSKNTGIKLAALKNRTSIAFIKNDSDKQQWLERYKSLQNKNPEDTASHLARILRFEAELTKDKNRQSELLQQSLSISQKSANRTAIAATLAQWAGVNIKDKQYKKAEDKSLRALFIRHQLGDVKNSLAVLKQLQTIYIATDNRKQALTKSWIEKISKHGPTNWEKLFTDFDSFPESKHAFPPGSL